MSNPTLRDAAKHVVGGELTPTFWNTLMDREGFCFHLLGVDGEDRAVFYGSDDGHLIWFRYRVGEDELEQDADKFVGPSLHKDSERVDPASAAFLWLTRRGEGWNWIHPRFRWLADALDELQDAPTA